jgi:hypothetical protein
MAQDADAIVVGGQSLAIWSRHYIERRPEIANVYSMTSEDVDFYGNRQAAEKFAAKLQQSKIYVPGPDDHTPHAAVIVGMVGERKIRADFMHSILGVDNKSIENNFVTLSGVHQKTGDTIDVVVLHPLDCLRSRMSNINDLGRTDPHSISSARASILILEAFLDDLLADGAIKEVQRTLRDLYFVIRACLGRVAFHKYGLDPRNVMRRFLNDARLDDRWRKFNLASAISRLDEREGRLRVVNIPRLRY